MPAMNSFDRVDTALTPVRIPETEPANETQQSECCCPEFCQLDHNN
jgi:hypothetical protein